MDKSVMAALLGRSLTTIEDDNYPMYLEIATENLEDLLCITLNEVEEARTFDTRAGYSTAYLDIFQSVTEVKVNEVEKDSDDYSLRQWDKRTGSWYNSLVLGSKFLSDDEIEVTATWGFDIVPNDLNLLLARMFALISTKNKFDGTVTKKQVEDFRIEFDLDADLDDQFYAENRKTIAKYGLCNMPNVQHGALNEC
jgi:hypothetical protein